AGDAPRRARPRHRASADRDRPRTGQARVPDRGAAGGVTALDQSPAQHPAPDRGGARASRACGAAWRVFRRVPPSDEEARALVLGSMAAITAFLIAGLFEYNFGDTEVLLVALAVIALAFLGER